jgi:hypothetical protein
MSTTQAHGSPTAGYGFGTLRSQYQIKTLIDISPTGVISEFRKETPLPFVDDLKQIINDQDTWGKSRNEQRNWETIVQCISIRAQPIMLEKPVVETADLFEFGYTGEHKVWTFNFGYELPDIYLRDSDPVKLLKEQLDIIPIVAGLNETVTLDASVLATTGLKVNTQCYLVGV